MSINLIELNRIMSVNLNENSSKSEQNNAKYRVFTQNFKSQ